MKAMRAAVEQREAIMPELLRVLETVAAALAEWAGRKDYMLHTFASSCPYAALHARSPTSPTPQ
jgi:hypothetical protein